MTNIDVRQAWEEVASKVGGVFSAGNVNGQIVPIVKATVGKWDMKLVAEFPDGIHGSTKLRGLYTGPSPFKFRMCKGESCGFFEKDDVETGDPAFDDMFKIKAQDIPRMKELLTSEVRSDLMLYKDIRIESHIDDGEQVVEYLDPLLIVDVAGLVAVFTTVKMLMDGMEETAPAIA